ncbi:MAG: diguanylate cyclase, partial [Clostridia bacterium]
MVFIIPTHYIYGFLSMVIGIFSIVALRVKDIACAQMDIVHLITCFVIGNFVSRHILVNRMSLYAMNRQLENEITERKREQEALRLQLEQHEIIMDQTTDILFKWDILKDDLLFSPNWLKKFGYEATGLKARGRITAWENIHPDDVQSFTKLITDTAAGKPYSEMEIRIQNIKGRYIWCRIRVTVQFSSEGQAIKAVGVILDVDEEKKEKYRLMKQAQRDSHTGLYNKAATNALVAHRMKDSDFTGLQVLMIIDIDCFKGINDTYGHAAGDGIIAAVAAQLRGHIRGNDVVGRIGGDEFLVYLAEVDSEEAALWKAQSLHAALNALIPVPGEPPITCSIGMAIFPHGTVEYSDLYQYADAALYQRKENGKNGVSVYDRQAGR